MDNGDIEVAPAKQTAITVIWDDEQQAPRVNFDPHQFRNWGFVKHVLAQAVDFADDMRRIGMAENLQRKAVEQQMVERQAQATAERINRKVLTH